MSNADETSPENSGEWGRLILDVIGCGTFALSYVYLCTLAPFAIVPMLSLLALPFFVLGIPSIAIGPLFLIGFDRGGRRTIEGIIAMLAALGVMAGACILGAGEVGERRILREIVGGNATFPWRDLVVMVSLSVLSSVLVALSLVRSRFIGLVSALIVGLAVGSFPIVLTRGFVYFIVLLELPYSA